MSEFVFVSMSHDYADEFDVTCCFVAKAVDINKEMDIVRLAFDAGVLSEEDEFYFGTNEALSFYSFDDFETGVDIKPCTEEFYNEFFELNAGGSVGYCVLDRLSECVRDRAAARVRALQEGND